MPSADLSPRIKAIQKAMNVRLTGEYDSATTDKLISIMQLAPPGNSMQDKKTAIQKKLGFTGKDVDGIFGIGTTTRLEFFVSTLLPVIPPGASMIVSKKGLGLIVESEISGEAVYNKSYKNPTWPKGSSGVTIGIGYDLGYESVATIDKDWSGLLSAGDVVKLKAVAGLTGAAAQNALSKNTADINSVSVSYDAAKSVFYMRSMPGYAKQTKNIYPGVEALPPDAQAALLSLIYNRGTDLKGDRRMEMKNIVALVANGDLAGIAAQFRSMKRLWTTAANKGLVIRREKEAVLAENANFFFTLNDIVIV